MPRIKSSAGHFRCTDLHVPLNNFEHRVQSVLLDKGVPVRVLDLHRDQNCWREQGRDGKFLSHTVFYA